MAKSILGYKPTTNPSGWGQGASGWLRGTTRAGTAKGHWIVKLGGRVGDFISGSPHPQITFLAYQADPTTWKPGALLGSTAAQTVTVLGNTATSNAGGANYEAKTTAPVPVAPNQPVTLAAFGLGSQWWHGQDNSGVVMHKRTGLAEPPDPYGTPASDPEGTMALWAIVFENTPPTIPETTLSPGPNGTTSDDTPTIEFDFRDAEEILEGFALGEGDYLKQYEVQIYNEFGTVKIHDSGVVTASSGERSARRASWTVPSALDPNPYRIRAQVWDALGAPSGWREWTVTVVGAGSIAITGPSGRTNDTTPDIDWSYSHATDLDMNSLVVRITTTSGTIVRSEYQHDFVTPQDNPSTGTLAFADTGWADLPPGEYRVEGKAVDSDSQPSPWSSPRTFRVNAAPLAPTSLQPANGAVGLARPQLSALVTDSDDASSTLTVTFHVREQGDSGDGTPITGLWDAGASRWYAATTGVITSGDFDTYEWRVEATDPWGLAGPATSWRAFSYVEGPTVTITSPGDPVSTSNPPFAWTVSAAQTDYRLVLRDDATGAILPRGDSGWVTSSTTGHTFSGLLLRHDTIVLARLEVLTTGDIPGSIEWTFGVAYTPPPSVTGVTAIPQEGPFDLPGNPTQILVSCDQVETTEPNFDGYLFRRRNIETDELVTLALLPSLTETTWIDDTAASGVAYEYQVVQRVWEQLDLIESLPATAQASVTLRTTVLSVVIGGSGRAVLPYWRQRSLRWVRDRTVRKSWAPKPRVMAGPQAYRVISGTYQAHAERGVAWTAADLVDAVHDLAEITEGPEGQPQPRVLCYRDPRGRVLYGVLMQDDEDDAHEPDATELAIDFQEVSFPGGVA